MTIPPKHTRAAARTILVRNGTCLYVWASFSTKVAFGETRRVRRNLELRTDTWTPQVSGGALLERTVHLRPLEQVVILALVRTELATKICDQSVNISLSRH